MSPEREVRPCYRQLTFLSQTQSLKSGIEAASLGGGIWRRKDMSTLNLTKTALIVIDMQEGVLTRAHQRDLVVTNVTRLVERARRQNVPVVWVQHHDQQLV